MPITRANAPSSGAQPQAPSGSSQPAPRAGQEASGGGLTGLRQDLAGDDKHSPSAGPSLTARRIHVPDAQALTDGDDDAPTPRFTDAQFEQLRRTVEADRLSPPQPSAYRGPPDLIGDDEPTPVLPRRMPFGAD